MKLLNCCCALLLLFFLSSCGESAPDEEGKVASTQLLQEEFAPASYASLLDSAQQSGELSSGDHDLVLKFIRDHARSIPAGHTLATLLQGAQGNQFMQQKGLDVAVTKINITSDRKIYGFNLHLAAHNHSEVPVERLRGYIQWLNEAGETVKNSPSFSMRGKLPPNGTLDNVLLQTAYYKPTGNELNDHRQKAWRDTLKTMQSIAGNFDSTRFRFQLTELRLVNGLTAEKYWLQTPEEQEKLRNASPERKRIQGLQGWPKKNPEWMEKLTAGLGTHFLEITPILTNKGELTHGEYLVFDRIQKVERFFIRQAKVPSRRVNPTGVKGDLVHFEEVDFWKWPMELRIYAADID